MALKINTEVGPHSLLPKLKQVFELAGEKILDLERTWLPSHGTPVFTVKGKYTSRGWTEWTQGFQFGSALLQFDATGEPAFVELGRDKTRALMASHVSHVGVHDHGFNNVSTYGNLLRLMREGKIPLDVREQDFYELALKVSGAVQAARWTSLPGEEGYIYSFNGPHSLFVDTIRSLRSLALAHKLGHTLMGEQDRKISLLDRLVKHVRATADHNVYYGSGRDAYDLPGRTAHEAIFNLNDGAFRCPSTQQGYSPFSTWTRGLAWALLGSAEQLEFAETLTATDWQTVTAKGGAEKSGRASRGMPTPAVLHTMVLLKIATATAEFYLANSCTDGVPVWDTGAPNLHQMGDYLNASSDPFNRWEPVDSSAAAIAAQGLIRLGNYLLGAGEVDAGVRYRQAGFTIAETLFSEPYLSTKANHQGLLLHSVYHRPKGWDYIAPGQKVPNGESSMWGDYHALELALLLLREARGDTYLTFFGAVT